jgi:ribosomal protein S18 acetylase RimI-like enzyme
MKYYEIIKLKDGRACILRNGTESDGEEMLSVFKKAHEETDYLLTYPEECTFTVKEEGEFLQKKTDSDNEIEIVAEVDGKIVGSAGIERVGVHEKLRHRCDFGISILREYWRIGIGTALTLASIECAKQAGYEQMELEVVAENKKAVELYKKVGFAEYGRNPRDFKSRISGYQEVIYMRLELEK